MNLVEKFEKDQIKTLLSQSNKVIPEMSPGDTVKVSVNIQDGNNKRKQDFEGVIIAKRNAGINSSILVRKTSGGFSVERRFILYSPVVINIKVMKRGVVRRAKLYYLRDRKGKAARIKEKIDYRAKSQK